LTASHFDVVVLVGAELGFALASLVRVARSASSVFEQLELVFVHRLSQATVDVATCLQIDSGVVLTAVIGMERRIVAVVAIPTGLVAIEVEKVVIGSLAAD